jgi:CxxC-x17-CxxC domain-containing protein
MAYQDIILQCSDCGCDFVFTAGEQEFYESKGLTNSPKRCKNCRSQKKRSPQRFGHKKMYRAICSECGCQTEVPFIPSNDKPVYCKECFLKTKV